MLEASCETELLLIQEALDDLGIKSFLIKDQGRTEIDPGSTTALGVEIRFKEELSLLKKLKLYK